MDGLKRDATERFSDAVFFLLLMLMSIVCLNEFGDVRSPVTLLTDQMRRVDVNIQNRGLGNALIDPADYSWGAGKEPTAVEYGGEQVRGWGVFK